VLRTWRAFVIFRGPGAKGLKSTSSQGRSRVRPTRFGQGRPSALLGKAANRRIAFSSRALCALKIPVDFVNLSRPCGVLERCGSSPAKGERPPLERKRPFDHLGAGGVKGGAFGELTNRCSRRLARRGFGRCSYFRPSGPTMAWKPRARRLWQHSRRNGSRGGDGSTHGSRGPSDGGAAVGISGAFFGPERHAYLIGGAPDDRARPPLLVGRKHELKLVRDAHWTCHH
jgi:hypothetical protein